MKTGKEYFECRTNWLGKKVDIEDESILRLQKKKMSYIFNIFPELKNGKNKKAFCVGCGVGTEAIYLKSLGYDTYGCDISEYAIKRINQKNFFVHDMEKPLKGKYDLVIAIEVLEHLKNPAIAIRNIYEILKKGGIFIATTPNRNSPYNMLNEKFDETHISIKSDKQWMFILQCYNWDVNIAIVQFIPFIWKIMKFPIIGNSLIIKCKK